MPAVSQAALLGGNSLIPHDGLLLSVLEGRPLQLARMNLHSGPYRVEEGRQTALEVGGDLFRKNLALASQCLKPPWHLSRNSIFSAGQCHLWEVRPLLLSQPPASVGEHYSAEPAGTLLRLEERPQSEGSTL